MKHTIRGKRYGILEPERLTDGKGVKLRGRCRAPFVPAKTRWLASRKGQGGLEELDTWVHECLHACDWDDAEHAVVEKAAAIAGLLWKLGYRRTK